MIVFFILSLTKECQEIDSYKASQEGVVNYYVF